MFTSDLHWETGLHARENRFLFPSMMWKQEMGSARESRVREESYACKTLPKHYCYGYLIDKI